MFIAHDYIEEIECEICNDKVPYFEIKEIDGHKVCEYCLAEINLPETI